MTPKGTKTSVYCIVVAMKAPLPNPRRTMASGRTQQSEDTAAPPMLMNPPTNVRSRAILLPSTHESRCVLTALTFFACLPSLPKAVANQEHEKRQQREHHAIQVPRPGGEAEHTQKRHRRRREARHTRENGSNDAELEQVLPHPSTRVPLPNARHTAHRATSSKRWRKSASLGAPVKASTPLMAMAGVTMTLYFTATSGRSARLMTSTVRSGTCRRTPSMVFTTKALAASHLRHPGAVRTSTRIFSITAARATGQVGVR